MGLKIFLRSFEVQLSWPFQNQGLFWYYWNLMLPQQQSQMHKLIIGGKGLAGPPSRRWTCPSYKIREMLLSNCLPPVLRAVMLRHHVTSLPGSRQRRERSLPQLCIPTSFPWWFPFEGEGTGAQSYQHLLKTRTEPVGQSCAPFLGIVSGTGATQVISKLCLFLWGSSCLLRLNWQ